MYLSFFSGQIVYQNFLELLGKNFADRVNKFLQTIKKKFSEKSKNYF